MDGNQRELRKMELKERIEWEERNGWKRNKGRGTERMGREALERSQIT